MNSMQVNEKISSKNTHIILKGKHVTVNSIEDAKSKYDEYIKGPDVTTSALKSLDGNIMQGNNLIAYFKDGKVYDSNHRIIYGI